MMPRRQRHRALARLIALLLVTTQAPALAQQPPRESAAPPSALAEAGREFQHGERAFELGDYPRALRHFQEAERLAPHPSVRFNIAVCLEKLGRLVEAKKAYTELLDAGELSASARQEAGERAARVSGELVTLTLSGRRGTQVLIDGTSRCQLPCQKQLDPGPHQVEVLGRSQRFRVELAAGAKHELQIPHAPAPEARAKPAPSHEADSPSSPSRLGTLSIIGASTTLLGASAFTFYGLRTESLHEDYLRTPHEDLRERGLRARTTANIALGVALIGVALIAMDWLMGSPSAPKGAQRGGPGALKASLSDAHRARGDLPNPLPPWTY